MAIDIDVERRLGDRVIAARFTAGPGLTALFGPSGAGKTSILNMVAGLLRPERGHIRIGDRTLFDGATDLRPEARRVGYVFQDGRLFPHRRVRANLTYGFDLAPSANRWMTLDEAARFLGIDHLLGRWPQSLSGGEAQRVAIGRALLAGNFIRTPEQLDYLQEPDVFHDVFGHVPMLADPVFADYMVAYGEGGLRSLKFDALKQLARLYWYTVEFGLIREAGGLRIYGAGIVSSFAESVFALDSDSPNRIGFDLARVMRTDYRIDDFQQNYFVIDSLEQLLDTTVNTDFAPLYAKNAALPPIPIADFLPDDEVITRGTQDYALAKSG